MHHQESLLPADTQVSKPSVGVDPLVCEPKVLTITEAAQLLRCSKAHLFHIIAGKVRNLPPLPVLRIGRRVLIRREALLHWMEWLEGRETEIQRGSGLFSLHREHSDRRAGT